MSYKNYKWEKVASDYESFLFRNYIIVSSFFKYPNMLNVSKVAIGVINVRSTLSYIADINTWNNAHEELKELALDDYKFVGKLINKTIEYGEKFNKWSEENIYDKDVSVLAYKEIIDIYDEFIEKQEEMYALGTALPILDFHDFKFIESNLKKILKNKVSDNKCRKYFKLFTEPIKNSFAKDQEEDLLKIISEYFRNKEWAKNILNNDFNKINNKYPKFGKKIKEHTKKYAWVYYVYSGPAYDENNFLFFIRDYIKKDLHPDKILKINKDNNSKIEEKKFEFIKNNELNDFEKEILDVAGIMVWGKPRRKDYQSKSYYHIETLQREIGKRLYLSLNQVRSLPINILYKSLKEGSVDPDIPNQIFNYHACLPNYDETVELLIGDKAKQFNDRRVQYKKVEDASNINKIEGDCACESKAQGVVKIINRALDMVKMNDGDILVSTATTPAIVPAMKKASAIVTDEGGLTCHAAIVSRELNIPCVIGTKIATSVLKDGDKVEVDAEKGIVKKIK